MIHLQTKANESYAECLFCTGRFSEQKKCEYRQNTSMLGASNRNLI
ncbi:unnamed protein product [Acanthoscelides obtectus]|uniref:Uncharacterized protein n=1 Tax=Acanthoscelides obtectus TaxID=200917 RepID=A0A9P0Q8B4_ACAOB|nr:unnamed protein product [Acanthoscelides obtectus]CAK1675885.1 hypothetical protein AOBTE_LOCUS30466 [Acanthoscelides obtectus]